MNGHTVVRRGHNDLTRKHHILRTCRGKKSQVTYQTHKNYMNCNQSKYDAGYCRHYLRLLLCCSNVHLPRPNYW